MQYFIHHVSSCFVEIKTKKKVFFKIILFTKNCYKKFVSLTVGQKKVSLCEHSHRELLGLAH